MTTVSELAFAAVIYETNGIAVVMTARTRKTIERDAFGYGEMETKRGWRMSRRVGWHSR